MRVLLKYKLIVLSLFDLIQPLYIQQLGYFNIMPLKNNAI